MTPIVFHAVGKPEPQGSAKAFNGKNGAPPRVTSDNPALRQWRNVVADAARQHCSELVAGPVQVTAIFVLTKSKSRPKTELHPAIRPDVDKLARGLLDALTHVVLTDDAAVVRLDVRKRWATGSEQPGAWVRIEDMP